MPDPLVILARPTPTTPPGLARFARGRRFLGVVSAGAFVQAYGAELGTEVCAAVRARDVRRPFVVALGETLTAREVPDVDPSALRAREVRVRKGHLRALWDLFRPCSHLALVLIDPRTGPALAAELAHAHDEGEQGFYGVLPIATLQRHAARLPPDVRHVLEDPTGDPWALCFAYGGVSVERFEGPPRMRPAPPTRTPDPPPAKRPRKPSTTPRATVRFVLK